MALNLEATRREVQAMLPGADPADGSAIIALVRASAPDALADGRERGEFGIHIDRLSDATVLRMHRALWRWPLPYPGPAYGPVRYTETLPGAHLDRMDGVLRR